MAIDITATDCTKGWVFGAPSTGVFYRSPNFIWPRGENGIPNYWRIDPPYPTDQEEDTI